MIIYLDDVTGSKDMYPFGQVKSIAHIRIGMLTILEKWQHYFGDKVLLKSQHHEAKSNYKVFPALDVPSNKSLRLISSGHPAQEQDFVHLSNVSDIFKYNGWALRQDFEMITAGQKSAPIPDYVYAKAPGNIFVEPGADISSCFINAEEGPVYISGNAHIMEGVMIRGPLYLGQNSMLKMGAKLYGSTTIGPFCLVGGEVKNSVLMGFSNKAHEGYLGDSVIGEWCNMGAGTSTSNLKNNASIVSITIDPKKSPVRVGIKCGLLMGDYTRCAINTSFNTGTVVGLCCNLFGENPEKFVPSFSWGKTDRYQLGKLLEDINNWKKLKGFEITKEEKDKIRKLYNR